MTDLQFYLFRGLERVFGILALMTLAGAFIPYLFAFSTDSESMARDFANEVETGNIKFQAATLAIYAVGLLYILAERARLPTLLAGNWVLLALIGYALFSALWSYYPDATFRRAFALLLTTTFAFYLVLRFTPRELIQMVAWALFLGAALSLVLVILYPGSMIHHDALAGSWRGSFGHKNRLGRMMALGVVVFSLLLIERGGKLRGFNWIGLALCGFMLAMAQSRTAWVTAIVLLMLVPVLRFLRNQRLPMSLRLGSVLILGFAAVMVGSHFLLVGLEALGRDMTFSGRTTIWTHAIHAGMNHAMLGAGYRSFWTPEGASYVYARLWAVIGNGHNGYLDVWLELGFIGLGLFSLMLLTALSRTYSRLIRSNDTAGLFYALVMIYALIYSFTEKFLLEQSELTWMLILVTLIYLTPRRVPVLRTTRVAPGPRAPSPARAGHAPSSTP
jgi:exopolysaccharide production protein ExoQ